MIGGGFQWSVRVLNSFSMQDIDNILQDIQEGVLIAGIVIAVLIALVLIRCCIYPCVMCFFKPCCKCSNKNARDPVPDPVPGIPYSPAVPSAPSV